MTTKMRQLKTMIRTVQAAAGSVYAVEGPCRLILRRGSCEAVGKKFKPGQYQDVPVNKTVPFEFTQKSRVHVIGDTIPLKLPGRTIPPSWDKLVARIHKSRSKIVLVLGEMDVGKTFFTTYVANRLIAMKRRASVIDCDIGQSDVGPPCMLGATWLRQPEIFLADAPVDRMSFIGAHAAGHHMPAVLVGLQDLARAALDHTDTVIIDTAGWVQGDGGRMLKCAKIDLLKPDVIVLLQRNVELEHFAVGQPKSRIVRIHVSKKASNTSPDVRKQLREALTIRYFKDAKPLTLSLKKAALTRCFMFSGQPLKIKHPAVLYAERLSAYEGALVWVKRPLTPEERQALCKEIGVFALRQLQPGVEHQVVVGLHDANGTCLGMGSIDAIDPSRKTIRVVTPVSSPARVKSIAIGSIKYDFTGHESGLIEPGTF